MRQPRIDVVPTDQKFLENRNDHGVRECRENQQYADDQKVTRLAIPSVPSTDFVLRGLLH